MSRMGSGLRKSLVLVGVLALVVPLLFAFAAPVSAATITVCASGCDYTKIQDAVGASSGGDVILVYPGQYDESVILDNMNVPGALTLRTVNASGGYEPHTATVDGGGSGDALRTNGILPGDLTIEGFVVLSDNDDGIDVQVNSGVVIRDVIANGTGSDGVRVQGASGNVTVEDCTANENGGYGIDVEDAGGDVGITDCTTNGNGEDGVYVSGSDFDASLGVNFINGGDVTIENCTSNGNDESGFDPEGIEGTLSIQACIARDNYEGVDLDQMWDAESVLVNGSIICGNECGVYLSGNEALLGNGGGINLEGNWWGCPGGPEAAGCDPICQADSIPVDFTPWISKISASATVDPANVGQPTVVSFQFSGNPSAVYLGKGPGDLRGPAPFTVTTDNGTLNGNGSTVKEFVGANGMLKVTLVPERGGTATVWVDGPCGLDESIVLGVVAAEEFVPEPGSVMLLASGLMGLAGYAGLRLRKK